MDTVDGFLRVWAWLSIIGGIVGGGLFAYSMSYEAGGLWTSGELDAIQFWTFWIGTSAAAITWGAVLIAIASIVESLRSIRERETTRMVR